MVKINPRKFVARPKPTSTTMQNAHSAMVTGLRAHVRRLVIAAVHALALRSSISGMAITLILKINAAKMAPAEK